MREGVLVAGLGAVLGSWRPASRQRGRCRRCCYGTSPADPLTLAASAFVLVGVACCACYIPARRATRIDPVRTLVAQ